MTPSDLVLVVLFDYLPNDPADGGMGLNKNIINNDIALTRELDEIMSGLKVTSFDLE